MIVLRRPASLRAGLARVRYQSTDAPTDVNTASTPAPVIPERIAKFRRTTAPMLKELSGVQVPNAIRSANAPKRQTQPWPYGEAPSTDVTKRAPKTRKVFPDADSYYAVAEAALTTKSFSEPRGDSQKRTATRGPNREDAKRTERSSEFRKSRATRRGPPKPDMKAKDENLPTFNPSEFIASQNFEAWKNADGQPLSEDEVANARKSLFDLMQTQPFSEPTNIEEGTVSTSKETPESFGCFVEARSARAAAETPSQDVSPVPWNFTLQAHPSSPWERTRYTANPSPSVHHQQRSLKHAQTLFSHSMKDPSAFKTERSAQSSGDAYAPISEHRSSLAVPAKAVEASRGAQMFRHEVVAGDYTKHALSAFEARSPASSVAKTAVLSNNSLSLEDRLQAVSLVHKVARS